MPLRSEDRGRNPTTPRAPQLMRQVFDHAIREGRLVPLHSKVVQLVALGTQIAGGFLKYADHWVSPRRALPKRAFPMSQ